ncbi:collagenase-like [Pieris rapae]|uniref:collagenase-like n=1 Tax=Pieris rapae TaxID=64459 RepID=UPI001E27E1AA|nr:collagenase-like [Pieris rapae]
MRLLILFSVLVTINNACGEYEPLVRNYHGEVGIPEAARIRAAEAAMTPNNDAVKFPFVAGLIIKLTSGEESVCSASLLSNTILVTAAQCWRTNYHQGETMTVVLGSNRLFSGGVRVDTNDVVILSSYNMDRVTNDVAVVTIKHVDFTDNIKSIPLDSRINPDFYGTIATVVGYGTVGADKDRKSSMRDIKVEIIRQNQCYFVFGYSAIVASVNCAKNFVGNISCTGDTGGPLIINNTLGGIASFTGPQGCERNIPVAYTLIIYVGPWIKQFL